MLRRLLLGQPKREAIECKRGKLDEDKSAQDAFIKSNAKNAEEKIQAKEDISDSDSETESSDTEESDAESLDNSSRTDSFEDCSGDILEWKGFELLRDERVHEGTQNNTQVRNGKILDKEDRIGSSKGSGSSLETTGNVTACQEGEETKHNQENPFANAFDIQNKEMSQIQEERDSHVNNINVNNDISSSNNNNNLNPTTNSNNPPNDVNKNKNNEEDENSKNKTNNQGIKNNIETHQPTSNNTERLPNDLISTNNIKKAKSTIKPTINSNNNNTVNHQVPTNNSKQKTNKRQIRFDENQSKTKLHVPKPPTTNHIPTKTNPNGISRHNSFRGNQHTPNTRKQIPGKIENVPGKSSKLHTDQSLTTGNKRTTVDTKWYKGTGKNITRLKEDKSNGNGRQSNVNSTNVSVNDLEKILGVNVAELREVIKKFKSDKIGTTEDSLGQNDVVQGDLGSPATIGEHTVDVGKSQDVCRKDEAKQRKGETVDNKDEISSDSGVSEPDAHSTDGQPCYIPLKVIIKRREYLEGHIRKLEDRMMVMGDHKKDIQFVHDLFDLYSDGLAKVERNNAGVPCIANLKSILGCQLREMDEEEFKAKLKGLEDLGIPHFSEINTRIEKLRKRIRHTLDDERKCRSKGVQKLRFEIGKVQGMCEAVLDCVYEE